MGNKNVVVRKTRKVVIPEPKARKPKLDPWDTPVGQTGSWQDDEDPIMLLGIISSDLAMMAKDMKTIITNLKKKEVKRK